MKKLTAILTVPLIFFLISFLTLKNYGINWDEPIHFMRGQAYFTYFVTGKTDVQKLSTRPSFFQNPSFNAAYFLTQDSGHPPLNGIIASLSNFIFYQKMHVLGDIDSYHLFNIISGTIMVFVVCIFAYQTYGTFPAIVAGLSLSTYPLFFSESHFNIKDPPQAAFFAAAIWLFWLSLKKFEWKWLIASAIAFSFSFSMKFNILFLPFIILPFLFVRYFGDIKKVFRNIPRSYLIALILSPFLIALIFVGTWPYLWSNPWGNFLKVAVYYKDIGTGLANYPGYSFANLNFYPVYWILVTTSPLIIILTLLGIIGTLVEFRKKDKTALLWLFWFLIPIARVTLPGTAIYGGIRQIFEYLPAMALLSGLGSKIVLDRIKPKFKKMASLILLILFIPQIITLIKLHPNENVYFNFLAGGLHGAREKNIPFWGNSYGNAYWQGIQWMNANSQNDARLALIQGTGLNVPLIQLRKDIKFSNNNWSGIFRGGEYLMELTFNSGINPYPYVWEYVDNFLDPVFEASVDEVPIVKVWKNDLEHTKVKFKKPEVMIKNYEVVKKENEIYIIFEENVLLTRFFLHYAPDNVCQGFLANIQTSLDNINWIKEKEGIPNIQVTVEDLPVNTSPFFFAARNLKYLKIITSDKNSCLLNNTYFDIWGLE